MKKNNFLCLLHTDTIIQLFKVARPLPFQQHICQSEFFLTIAYQNTLLGRDFVRGISRLPCAPGVALDAGLATDVSCLGFPHHLQLFLPYGKENPREKEKKQPNNFPEPRWIPNFHF